MAAGLFAALALMGCSTGLQVRALSTADLPPQSELTEAPFFPQEAHQCGPAALATTLQWSGVAIHPDDLAPKVYLPQREGSLQLELLAASRAQQRIPYRLRPRLADLLREVAAGHPVLVLQNLGLDWLPRWHYAVVVGYDLAQDQVILRSGRHRRVLTPLATFERTWRRGDYWALLTLPPERLPATAQETRWLAAVTPFEQLGHWETALSAYRRALLAWPQSEIAALGVGNSLYALGDQDQAAAAFATVTQQHPQSGIAYNNLAQVLFDLGQLEAAKSAAYRAVELGGPMLDTFHATLEMIRRAKGE